MTKVLSGRAGFWGAAMFCMLLAASPLAQSTDANAQKPAEQLYQQLRQVGLDPDRVFQVRDAFLDRSAIHISFEDGTIGFTQDVMGRITGAFFEGDGEILLTPGNEVERRSMSLFTGMAILEEHFATAYLRFNDDAANELRPGLRAAQDKQGFLDHWGATAKNLADGDATRLLMTFSRMLPVKGIAPSKDSQSDPDDRFLHGRFQGTTLGVFDVFFDSEATEPVQAAQAKTGENGNVYYDVWASFAPNDKADIPSTAESVSKSREHGGKVEIRGYTIKTEVQPPKRIHARAQVRMHVRETGPRTLLFELSRFLQVESVKLDGEPVEFIHNPAVEGTQLSRRGNDIVAVILPEPPAAGRDIELEFSYGGEVLAEAGAGLLYVGARGTWYPNRGLVMADFDLTFAFPPNWTLVATGKLTAIPPTDSPPIPDGLQKSRWVSDRPIPLAGFNLGKYKETTVVAGTVPVETYATTGVEQDFPIPRIQVVQPTPADPIHRQRPLLLPTRPSPAHNELPVGQAAASAIEYYSQRFGPYPYSHLALTQMPGHDSQGWPGLVFLSSYAFLTQQDREALHFPAYRTLLEQSIPAHETAHQWWGDLVTWTSYRDQWISEGLSNYCALMMLQERDPAGFRVVMDKYREDLLAKDKDGMGSVEAGPVTIGQRLLSSKFPEGYEEILYGRGTWLFHMLRSMLKDAAPDRPHKGPATHGDEPFVQALRKIRERYAGKSITTRELLEVFAEDLPPSLRYEGKDSLDWFLQGWINGTAVPKLELKSVKFAPKGTGPIAVSGTILQKEAPPDLVTSVPVYAVLGSKQQLLGRVFADGEESTFRLTAPAGTHKLVLDPNATILTSPK